jgi:hypothetical protein
VACRHAGDPHTDASELVVTVLDIEVAHPLTGGAFGCRVGIRPTA